MTFESECNVPDDALRRRAMMCDPLRPDPYLYSDPHTSTRDPNCSGQYCGDFDAEFDYCESDASFGMPISGGDGSDEESRGMTYCLRAKLFSRMIAMR
jgi:hypothetical protein